MSQKSRNPELTDNNVIKTLKDIDIPIRFHELSKLCNYTSGKLQKSVKRLLERNKIVQKKVPIPIGEKNRAGRSFITMISLTDWEAEVIIPIRMDETTAKIIETVPEVTNDFDGLDDLFRKALVEYFKSEISAEIKIKAIKLANKKGLISNEKRKELIGDA